MVTKTAENIVAPNNLHKMIVRSGLKSNMVAELKGIQPPTLSRHKNGDIGISLTDAEEYAKILNCTPQQIFFSNPAIPIIGAALHWNEACTVHANEMSDILLGSHQGGNPELALCHRMEQPRMSKYENKAIYVHNYYQQDTMGIYWDLSDDLDHPSAWQHGNIDIVNADPIWRNVVDKNCFGRYSLVKTKSGNLLYGIVYQSSRKKYTLESNFFGCHENLELEWACPIISMLLCPELNEMQWVDYDVTAYRKKIMPNNN